MPTDVRKITESRKAEREAATWEQRNTLALESIADMLDAIRADAIGAQHLLAAIAQRPSK